MEEEKQQRKSVRDAFAEKFISILESNEPLQWVKGWSSGGYSLPYNGQTERRYNGINRMILMFKAMEMDWSDPRFYTFNQVSQMDGCKIRAGEKATAVEYWLVRDTKEKRSMTFSEYEKLLKDDPSRKEVEFYAYPKTAYVFNAAQVEGLQLLHQPERPPLEENKLADEIIKTMSENMEVRLIYGGNEAYYNPATDTVHLPPRDSFYTVEDYASTCLHELAHATSAPSRLDRHVVGYHQNPELYAKEELFAEIASTYASAEIGLEVSDSVINNHAAYVQHWLKAIKENHNVLFTAIKEADKIADYLIEKGRVAELKEKLSLAAEAPQQLEGMSYEIWQLKDAPENKALLFSDYTYASLFRLDESRYDKVYEARAGADDDSLGSIYYKFNVNHPEDFKGHSLSMSDVVVLNDNGKKTAFYVDRIGFREVSNFCRQPQQVEKRGRAR